MLDVTPLQISDADAGDGLCGQLHGQRPIGDRLDSGQNVLVARLDCADQTVDDLVGIRNGLCGLCEDLVVDHGVQRCGDDDVGVLVPRVGGDHVAHTDTGDDAAGVVDGPDDFAFVVCDELLDLLSLVHGCLSFVIRDEKKEKRILQLGGCWD